MSKLTKVGVRKSTVLFLSLFTNGLFIVVTLFLPLNATNSIGDASEIGNQPPETLSAYDCYLKGREHLHRFSKEETEKAIEMFQEALRIDKNYALAEAGLSEAYSMFAVEGEPLSYVNAAIDEAQRALAIDRDLAEGYEALGYAYQFLGWNRKAIEALQQAIKLNPNYARAIGILGKVYLDQGRLEESLQEAKRYVLLDASSPVPYLYLGLVYDSIGETISAENAYKKGLAMDSSYLELYQALAFLHIRKGDYREAQGLAEKALSMSPEDPGVLYCAATINLFTSDFESAKKYAEADVQNYKRGGLVLSFIYSQTGRIEDARQILETVIKNNQDALQWGNESPYILYNLAACHAIQGKKEETYRLLHQAIDNGFIKSDFPLQNDPYFGSLRKDAEFQAIVSHIERKLFDIRLRIEQQ